MQNIKIALWAITLFFILHFETIGFNGVKLSHVWKGFLLVSLIILVFKNSKSRLHFYWPLIGLALINLLGFEFFNNTLNAVVTFLSVLLLPFIGAYSQGLSSKRVEKVLLFFAYFVIFSFIPYEVGLLSSLAEGYDLSSFGEIGHKGIIGPYQKVHSASSVLACSLLVILFFYFKGVVRQRYFFPIFFLGLYFLFFTYVRTGMVMFALGALPIILHFTGGSLKNWVRIFFLSLISIFIVLTFFLDNDVLMKRIKGERLYYSEDSVETYGSGRLLYAISTLDYFSEAKLIEKLVGLGETEGLDRMDDKIGRRLFPHNGFLFVLSSNGVIGFSLFSIFLLRLYKSCRSSQSENSVLAKSIFVAYLVMVFLQSYELIYVFVFLALSFSYAKVNRFDIGRISNSETVHIGKRL